MQRDTSKLAAKLFLNIQKKFLWSRYTIYTCSSTNLRIRCVVWKCIDNVYFQIAITPAF